MLCQARVSLLHELVLVDGGGNLGLGLTHGAAYHTSMTMNHNIVRGTQDRSRHSKGKTDPLSYLQRTVHLE
jgi:hypothetical protein